jgi:7,8-dihydropterin-6-yl-methyl-4-(beta-D-ribofuranosyl)aminobenzene 5'-phosphate synthase
MLNAKKSLPNFSYGGWNMRLTVLVENQASFYLRGEWGLSFFIEAEGQRILFDFGVSDLFLINAALLKIDLSKLDYLILSHGHVDHAWGLDWLLKSYLLHEMPIEKRPTLIVHPLALAPKLSSNGIEGGVMLHESILKRNLKTNLTKEPVWLSEHLVYLGEIERKIEKKQAMGETMISGALTADYLWDDTALAYKLPQGLVIITGCSHSGICNIVSQAQTICNEERIIDIVGGFHLLKPTPDRLQETIIFLQKINSRQLHPCHCTDLQSKMALGQVSRVKEVYCGLDLNYEE